MTVNVSRNQSWDKHKDEGKKHFQNEEFGEALKSYRASLNGSCPHSEKQIILSNIVACRLKIGGPAMAAAAVAEAKQCVALNNRWAKGHIRLASAYIALGDHSNDACNSLQRAISLDPSNQVARQMLMKELRRDTTSAPPTPTAPPEDMDDSRRSGRRQHEGVTPADASGIDDDGMEDSMSFSGRIKSFWNRVLAWYHDQPEDVKTLLKVIFGILLLYVMFGGRFGLGQNRRSTRGNYGKGNAYDRFNRPSSYEGDKYGNRNSNEYYRNDYDRNSYQRTYQYDDEYRSSSYYSNVVDFASVPTMLLIGGVMYFCHSVGINPFQALWMMQMIGGRGGGRRRYMGYGLGGMGYNMANNAGMFGRRHRPRRRGAWY